MTILRDQSLLAIIDMQPSFLAGCVRSEATLNRTSFLTECAQLLDVPIVATEQYPARMGGTDPELASKLAGPGLAKMAFSACGCDEFIQKVEESGKFTVILCGIETHICITQTALHLLERGLEVFVVGDAVTSRSEEANQIAFDRLRDAGAWVCHSESVVYEWMESADHPKFRDVLQLVKRYSASS